MGLHEAAHEVETQPGAVLRPALPEPREDELAVLGRDAVAVVGDDEVDGMQRTFLLSRAETIYGGANQIQRNTLGERVLGLPKEPR